MNLTAEIQVADERERCASIADDLAGRWAASAAKIRLHGTRKPWFGKPYVLPRAERDAKSIDAAVDGMRAVAMLIRGRATRCHTK